MTLDQLRIFVAVAEGEHLTRAARNLNLTPSAVSAAIQTLEQRYGVNLFHRVGRRIELSDEGRGFLAEAKAALASSRIAEATLRELGGLGRGALKIAASQTLTSYWLPSAIVAFAARHPAIDVTVTEGNTAKVAASIFRGESELGFIEGAVDEPALSVTTVHEDRLVVVCAPDHPLAGRRVGHGDLAGARWIMREPGSGTRSAFETFIAEAGIDPATLDIVVELPTNEAICAATRSGGSVTVVSELVAQPHIEAGRLRALRYALPLRQFAMLRHKERNPSKAGRAFDEMLQGQIDASRPSRSRSRPSRIGRRQA